MKKTFFYAGISAILACFFLTGCFKPGWENRSKSRKFESQADTYEKKAEAADRKAQKHYAVGECDLGLESGQEAVTAWADRSWAMSMSIMADRFAYAEEKIAEGFYLWKYDDRPSNPNGICKRDSAVTYRWRQDVNLFEYSKCVFKNSKEYSYNNNRGRSSEEIVTEALVMLEQEEILLAMGALLQAAYMDNADAAYFLGHLYLQMEQGKEALYWFTVARHLTTDSEEKLGLYEEKWGEIVADSIGYEGMHYRNLDLKGLLPTDCIQRRIPTNHGAAKKIEFAGLFDAVSGLCVYELDYPSAKLKGSISIIADAENVNKAIAELKEHGTSQNENVKAMLADLQHLATFEEDQMKEECEQYCQSWMEKYFQPEVNYWFKMWKPALEYSKSESE